GEKILFSAFIINSPSSEEYEWSKVIYLELISANSSPVFQAKYPVTEMKTDGYLQLPENLLTGNYYLKAYTRWMRNFSSSAYAWLQVKVINPFQAGVGNAGEFTEVEKEEKFIPVNKNFRKTGITCQTDKVRYNRRDKVVLNLTVPPGLNNLPENYCVSVIRPGAIDTINYGLHCLLPDKNMSIYPLKYIPDVRGLSLSGMVIEKSTRLGVSQAHVRLSVLGDNAEYSSFLTHENGGFLFALRPYHGTKDMYIAVEPKEDMSLEILVDNDYANDSPAFSRQPFKLSQEEKETATELMLHYQIEKAYLEGISDTTGSSDTGIRRFFYGKPANTIYIDDYIKLPTIEEVIFELVPEVSVIRRNDLYYLRSRNYISDLEVYRPLILIDNIPVSDIGTMLKMSPERIERIDVTDRIYAKGDLLFGGILNLISRKGDMAGIDLPKNSYFFNFDGFVQNDNKMLSAIENQTSDPRIPDVRNCLYWNPSVRIVPGTTTKIEFQTSDRTGNYMIVVRGVTEEGTIIEGISVFDVESSGMQDVDDD
ncbi:MAG TPA: hypothetical protein VJ346_05095, partial [Bacteroidales bacterium]|nr:hypothetical protein [Bacteroidales bacterium]